MDTDTKIYPSSHKQKTPLLGKMPTGSNTIPRFTHRSGCVHQKCVHFLGIFDLWMNEFE